MTLVSDDAASEIMQYGLDGIVETGEPVNEQQQIAIGALPLAQSTLQIVANETDASVLIGDIDLADADAEKALRRALVHSPHPYGADLFTGDVLSSAVISWSNENENGNNMYSQSGYRLCKDKNADGDLIVGEFDEDDGTWDCQVEVWAGSSSNGGRLSARFSVEDYPLFCFDYRITSNYQFLHFQWHVSGLAKWKQIDAPAGAFVKDDQWHSTCIDLVALFPAGATDLIGFRIASSSITGAISELQGAWIRSAAFVPLDDSASRNVYDVAITGQLPEVNVTLFAGPNAVGNSTDLPSSVEDFDAALGGIAYGDDVVVDLTASSTDAPILLANATWTLNTSVLALSASAADVAAALYPVTAAAPPPTVVRTVRPASGIRFTALWSSSDVRRASTGRLPLIDVVRGRDVNRCVHPPDARRADDRHGAVDVRLPARRSAARCDDHRHGLHGQQRRLGHRWRHGRLVHHAVHRHRDRVHARRVAADRRPRGRRHRRRAGQQQRRLCRDHLAEPRRLGVSGRRLCQRRHARHCSGRRLRRRRRHGDRRWRRLRRRRRCLARVQHCLRHGRRRGHH